MLDHNANDRVRYIPSGQVGTVTQADEYSVWVTFDNYTGQFLIPTGYLEAE